ncbi:hypothetical protein LZ30DRAFT_22021 [Colletotrichum cereale]|nr:hypothetical protein LZ30DRAFT_22021 [Colletotrichum cereale]
MAAFHHISKTIPDTASHTHHVSCHLGARKRRHSLGTTVDPKEKHAHCWLDERKGNLYDLTTDSDLGKTLRCLRRKKKLQYGKKKKKKEKKKSTDIKKRQRQAGVWSQITLPVCSSKESQVHPFTHTQGLVADMSPQTFHPVAQNEDSSNSPVKGLLFFVPAPHSSRVLWPCP